MFKLLIFSVIMFSIKALEKLIFCIDPCNLFKEGNGLNAAS